MYPRWSHKCSYVCLCLDVLYCFSMRCLVSSLVTQVFICVFVLRCVVLFQYEVSCILAGHTGSVTAVDAIYTSPTTTLIATTSTDSTIRIWSRDANQDGFECIQTITISASGFALAVSWAVLPESKGKLGRYKRQNICKDCNCSVAEEETIELNMIPVPRIVNANVQQ